MRSTGWSIASAASLLGFLMLGNAAAFEQKAGASSANAEIVAAEAWAFPVEQSPDPSVLRAQASKSDPHKLLHVPGSARSYTVAQLDDFLFSPPDWFPQDHSSMPQIVASGRKPAWACGSCHQPDGRGHPESAALAGMPAAYIRGQIEAFRDGTRAGGSLRTTNAMVREARVLNDTDLRQAATYFASLKFRPATRIVESASVPKTHWNGFVLTPDQDGARELLGQRIVETPANFKLEEIGDAKDGFIAWVPPGSIARGAVIAAKGAGTAPACESCHGVNLQGVGIIPPLAGRSPTYIVRELILFRTGQRSNPEAAPMRLEASQLSVQDMIAVAAYAASDKPGVARHASPGAGMNH